MHVAPPPSGFFLKTMYMAIRGQGALGLSRAAGSGEGRRAWSQKKATISGGVCIWR